MSTAVIVTFIIGYMAIVFEHPLKLDKTVPALIMAAVCWALISLGHIDLPVGHVLHPATGEEHDYYKHMLDPILLHHIGKTAEILIFLIGAMTIVELIDLHKGFAVITDRIHTTKKSTMLWLITPLAFFLSATLDNLACTIVLVSLLRKLVPVKEERIFFIGLAVIAANAGGAWSPIGDVTTTMLWINDNVTTLGLIVNLLLPSIICAVLPTFVMTRMPYMKGNITIPPDTVTSATENNRVRGGTVMFIAGLSGLIFVPIFKVVTHLPPYVGMMLSLGVVWMISEYLHPDEEDFENKHHYSAHNALSRIEMSSILFFLGILLSVAALESMGTLESLATTMDNAISNRDIVIGILGLGSALIDNVPLVAAAMGMYDVEPDGKLWHFLAYSAGTGGSMLIIGSAAGVAAMGLEKIDFMWYVKHIAWLALVGFFAGAAVFLLMYDFTSSLM